MPKGWTWVAMYWGRHPIPHLEEVRDWVRDAALCPEHTTLLDDNLKPLLRELDQDARGTA